ncbi:MAG TPA: SRPBCC family protein [Bacteroidia bacterium]|nr:SRPBCC family protein [Bacteroidia bacterium]
MTTSPKQKITVETSVKTPIEKVWNVWTTPEHIMQWNNASPDWHTPKAENDLRKGGKFLSKMEAKDGSFGFEFWGIYDEIDHLALISYTMGDGRKAEVSFSAEGNQTKITETFEAESENPIEMQKAGWQAILDNFKKYAESN